MSDTWMPLPVRTSIVTEQPFLPEQRWYSVVTFSDRRGASWRVEKHQRDELAAWQWNAQVMRLFEGAEPLS